MNGNKWMPREQNSPNFTNTILGSELAITEWQLFLSVIEDTSVAQSKQPSAVLQGEN